jgi:spore maturation protein CgeB
MIQIIKNILKKNKLVSRLNSKYKVRLLKKDLKNITEFYNQNNISKYDASISINSFKSNLIGLNPLFIPKERGNLNIFWIGTSINQDYTGFVQSLESFGNVEVFINHLGDYGLWNKNNEAKIYDKEVISKNSEALRNQIISLLDKKKPDVVIGQMWAGRISSEILGWIRELGIPVINISMDDLLPQHWKYKGKTRLGSIGLGASLDMVLTTTSNCCNWYWYEKVNSLYFPLAANPNFFYKEANAVRDIDILFIGNKYGIRESLINRVISEGFNIEVYGNGWPNGIADFNLSVDLSKKSKIILGVGTIGHCDDLFTLKLRDFEAPLSGALYITSRNPDLVDLFIEGEEMEYYESEEELINKLKLYTNNEYKRLEVAKKGQKKVISKHTWDIRLADVFSKIGIIQ